MVYFVYRSVYEGPSGRLVRHFPDATVLDWFRRVWDDASSHHRALRLPADFVPADGRDPGRTLIRCGDHLAQMAIHMDKYFGHRQWFVFDDVWAAAHPDLAASLMRFGAHWDPRCRREHARLTHCG